MIVDKTNRKIKVGQMVDINLNGMWTGKVVAIKEQPIMLSPTQGVPPQVIVQLVVNNPITKDGIVPSVYIVAEPDPKDPVVLAANEEEKGRSRILSS